MPYSTYLNVILVPIEESQVVVLNGEEYLMVDPDIFQKVASVQKKPARPYTDTSEMQIPILRILSEKAHLRSSVIRSSLREQYKIVVSTIVMGSLLQRMRTKGLVKSQGVTNQGVWSITPAGRRRLSDVK